MSAADDALLPYTSGLCSHTLQFLLRSTRTVTLKSTDTSLLSIATALTKVGGNQVPNDKICICLCRLKLVPHPGSFRTMLAPMWSFANTHVSSGQPGAALRLSLGLEISHAEMALGMR